MRAETKPRQRRIATAVGLVAALAAGLAIGAARAFPSGGLIAAAEFAPLLCAAAAMILRFRYRGQTVALEPFEAVMVPAVFALGPMAILLTAVAHLVANLYRRNEPIKTAFNVAQWTLISAVTTVTVSALGGTQTLSPRNLGVLIAAVAFGAITNVCTMTIIISVAEGTRADSTVRNVAPTLLLGWAINTAFGLLLVLAYGQSRYSVPLFAVPLALLHWARHGYEAALADRARMRGMHEAIRILAEPIDPRDALARFVEQVRACFTAVAAELVLAQEGGRFVYRASADEHASRLDLDGTDSITAYLLDHPEAQLVRAKDAGEVNGLLAHEGWEECLVAPVMDGSTPIGVLCAYDRSGPEGWEEGELAVLQALASEAGAVLRKGALLSTIVDERSKLTALIANTNDGIMALDASGHLVIWNPALERVTGWSAKEMETGRAIDRLKMRDESGRDVVLDAWTELPLDPPSELTFTTRDGETRALSCSYSRMADGERGPLMIVFARDVTEAREIEHLKDDFVATVSHELRTPLTPILGWAETLLNLGDRLTEHDREEAIQSIRRQALHLEALIVNLLEVAKIERGHSVARDDVIDVRSVATTVVEEFRARDPHRDVLLEMADQPCEARGDALFVRQIITNLVSNAIKYSPSPQHIHVRVGATRDEIGIAVQDHGPGIAAADQARVFDRFHRLGDPLRRSQGGAGLGLYIARQLARALDAYIDLESTPGDGSTFTLRLRPAATQTWRARPRAVTG